VDIKELGKLNKTEQQPIGSGLRSFIRTMTQDMTNLKKKGAPVLQEKDLKTEQKRSAPPAGLPVIESAKKSVLPLSTQPRPATEIPKPSIPLKKEFKRESEKKKEVKPMIKGRHLNFIFIGLAVILIIGGIGGFFYWWNYLRSVPLVTHFECQNNQCLNVEGEGEDKCQTDQDCQPAEPAEPVIPETIIPITETKIIELAIGEEDLLLERLKLTAIEKQTSNTLRRVLVKLVSPVEKKYARLDTLLSSLGITLPISIRQSIATSTLERENHTFFFYSQPEGNRLGLVINMKESSTLVQDLKTWEESMIANLRPLLLRDDVPAAATQEFQDNTYREIAIRYINFPDPSLTIDYALVADKLVITTSRESIYAVIDALLSIY
jgi:hypothetical protein